MMYDVTAIGEVLIDFVQTSLNDSGYPMLSANPGGAPGNYICTLSRYGMKTRMVGKVGRDTFGGLLKATLQKQGVDTAFLMEDPDVFTTLAFVTLDSTGDRSFAFARKPGADTCFREEELPEDIGETRILHFGTLSLTDEPMRTATLTAVKRAKQAGALISLDPNLRLSLWKDAQAARDAMRTALPLAEVVKLSEEELDFLFDGLPGSTEERLQRLHRMGPRLIFLTLGAQGCRYSLDGKIAGSMPAEKVKVADTTGAGDIFGGATAYGLLQHGCNLNTLNKTDLENIVRFAGRAAGLSTERHGGIPSIPSLEEIKQRYSE